MYSDSIFFVYLISIFDVILLVFVATLHCLPFVVPRWPSVYSPGMGFTSREVQNAPTLSQYNLQEITHKSRAEYLQQTHQC